MNEMNRAGGVRRRVVGVAVTALMVPLVFLGIASSAALAAPKGVFAVFAQCPTSIPGLALCQYVEVTGGELVAGPMRIPVDKTIVFQGGAIPTGGPNFNEYFLLPAANGESVSPTDLDIPGGLRTVIGCQHTRGRDFFFRAFRQHGGCSRGWYFHNRASRVTARIEPVASPTNPAILNLAAVVEEQGAGLTFPARVHLKNPLLGEACYLGSEAHPIELHLTDGTTNPPPPNQPIKGRQGTAASEVEEGYEALRIANDTLVDNAFSIPPAEGCGGEHLSSIIDPMIDQTLGLESPAGHNTAILTGTHKVAEVEAVLASETFPTKENPSPSPHHHHHHWWWQAR